MVDMMNPAAAANAYANIAKTASTTVTSTGAAPTPATSFTSLLEKAAESSIGIVKNAETVQGNAVIGKANLVDVVQASTAAELTVQTAVAVRDRVVGAYQEIMRMPI